MKTLVAVYEEGLFDLRGAKPFKGGKCPPCPPPPKRKPASALVWVTCSFASYTYVYIYIYIYIYMVADFNYTTCIVGKWE